MPKYKIDPADVITLNTACDYAKKGGEAAAKAAAKVYLTESESEALSLSGYAEEAKHFLGNMIAGQVELAENHREAIKTGLRLYYADILKTREREQLQLIDSAATDDRLAELRTIVTKLRLNVQLDLEDEAAAAAAEPAGVGA